MTLGSARQKILLHAAQLNKHILLSYLYMLEFHLLSPSFASFSGSLSFSVLCGKISLFSNELNSNTQKKCFIKDAHNNLDDKTHLHLSHGNLQRPKAQLLLFNNVQTSFYCSLFTSSKASSSTLVTTLKHIFNN